MKYCAVIIDGAAGLPLPEHGGKTCLEVAHKPNLDAMAREGMVGLARTVPPGMEPSSAIACMSVLGYDPKKYYRGRAGIEALSMGIPINDGEVVFRCNLVTVLDGVMKDYSAGHIRTEEAGALIQTLNEKLGNAAVWFYPGVSYRHICKLGGHEETLSAVCTPPHDIPDKPVANYLPKGEGSRFLLGLMEKSKDVLRDHPVNAARKGRGENPATTIWLFWGSGRSADVSPFTQAYGPKAVMTSAVDLLNGLARMTGMDTLNIRGVTDGPDNDYKAQAEGALKALADHDLAVIHIEAPDEAGHAGSVEEKVDAIEKTDAEVISRLRSWRKNGLRVLVMPDHPTPISLRTHSPEPVPFILWGPGFRPNGAGGFSEKEAGKRDLFLDPGYNIMGRLTKEVKD